MICPKCQKPMVKLLTNVATQEELWKCRICSYKEKVSGKTPGNSKSKVSSEEKYKEGSDS